MFFPIQEIEVTVENFQSLEKANLKFETGISLIQGSNSCGKTAVFRALNSFYFNSFNDSFIRNGQNETKIEVIHNNRKASLTRWRESSKKYGSKGIYEIEGEIFTKTGREAPPELIEITRIEPKESESAGITLHPNFWLQEAPPFLLNLSPAKIYDFLLQDRELLEILGDLKTTQKEASTKTKFIENRFESEEKESLELQKKQKELSSYDSLFLLLDLIEEAEERLEGLILTKEKLKGIRERKTNLNQKQNKNFKIVSLLNSLPNPENYKNLSALKEILLGIKKSVESQKNTLKINFLKQKSLYFPDMEEDLASLFHLRNVLESYKEIKERKESFILKQETNSHFMEEVKISLESFDVCPLCSSELVKF